MSIKEVTESKDFYFEESQKEVVIESKGKKLIFYANALSYFQNQSVALKGRDKNLLALLVAESITDKDGNRFSYDDVLKLDNDIAKPLLDAAISLNAKGLEEKK